MGDNQSVPLNLGTGGKNVRTLELQVLLADGSIGTVQQQVLSIADEQGHVLTFGSSEDLLRLIHLDLKAIRLHLELNS